MDICDDLAEQYSPQNLTEDDWELIEKLAQSRLDEFGEGQETMAAVFAYFDFLFSISDHGFHGQ